MVPEVVSSTPSLKTLFTLPTLSALPPSPPTLPLPHLLPPQADFCESMGRNAFYTDWQDPSGHRAYESKDLPLELVQLLGGDSEIGVDQLNLHDLDQQFKDPTRPLFTSLPEQVLGKI